jgi:arylsulfatase
MRRRLGSLDSLVAAGLSVSLACCASRAWAAPEPPPNIVLMFPDNLGIGEVGVYGGNRGVPTPRLDRLAAQGLRLTNFNTEYFCTPSRAAILTGRHGIRSGTNGNHRTWGGLTQWEITLAETLATRGYASALYGKWHLGDREGRYPTDQGFGEWYGIPLSSNEAQASTTGAMPYIWEGRSGEPSRKVKVFDMDTRRTLDREVVARGVAFLERHARTPQPFFLFLPLTQVHFPTLAHPDFAGTTGAGDVGDAMAEMDHNVGVVLDAVARLGLEGNTIVIWTTDGGAEFRRPWRGTSGPWRGFYTTAMEGGLRTPFMIRWPGRIPAGRVSDEIVHEVDVYTTLARAAGAAIPTDRAVDGVDQLAFFEGARAKSAREGFPVFMGTQVRAVKWHEWKLHYAWQDEPTQPAQPIMKLFNLRSDPKEETDVKDLNPWAESVLGKVVDEFNASLEKYPLVPLGAPDPYEPKRSSTNGAPAPPPQGRVTSNDTSSSTERLRAPDSSTSSNPR